YTRWFRFVPDEPWTVGQRYWLVICAKQEKPGQANRCNASATTIVGRDDGEGLKYVTQNGEVVNLPYSDALNSNPLQGTGTQAGTTNVDKPADAARPIVLSQGFIQAAGGPD